MDIDKLLDRPSVLAGVPVGEAAIFAGLACAMGLLLWGKTKEVRAATRHSQTILDLSVQRQAIEAFAADAGAYPRMSCGASGRSGDGDYHGGVAVYGTLTVNMTTPIAYLPSRVEDKVATAFSGTSRLYRYEDADTHQSVAEKIGCLAIPGGPDWAFRYVENQKAAMHSFEEYFGEYVVWGVGPSGEMDFSSADMWVQYDPTNGSTSSGNTYVSQESARPIHNPPFVRLLP